MRACAVTRPRTGTTRRDIDTGGEEKAGAANRTRTCDPVITNDVLYQLSYCGGPNAALSQRSNQSAENACHLISGSARLGKKNATPRPSATKIPASRRLAPW